MKAGDLIFVSGKGAVSAAIQVGTLSLPNVGPLGRWGWSGMSHVAIVVPVFGELYVYESTSFGRPTCVRTGRENPTGVQAHTLETILNGGGDVWHYPLRRPLYLDEEERLLNFCEMCLGRSYDFWGAGKSGGKRIMRLVQWVAGREDMSDIFCSELCAKGLSYVGIMQVKNASAYSPEWLRRVVLREGICDRGELLSG